MKRFRLRLKMEAEQILGEAVKENGNAVHLEDREWQLNKNLNDSMLEMFTRQVWTDVTFTFPQHVRLNEF